MSKEKLSAYGKRPRLSSAARALEGPLHAVGAGKAIGLHGCRKPARTDSDTKQVFALGNIYSTAASMFGKSV